MVFESRLVRAWIILSVFSIFLYALYQLINSLVGEGYRLGFGSVMAVFGSGPDVYSDRPLFLFGHFFPELGLFTRFIGLTIMFASFALLFAFGKSWLRMRKVLALAFFLESLFLLGFIATIPMLVNGISIVFAISYGAQVFLAAPMLIVLSWNLRKANFGPDRLLKFGGLALAGYAAAIMVNNVSRVYSANVIGLEFLVEQTGLGIFNAVVMLPLALAIAVAGLFIFTKRKNPLLATKLFAFSLSLIGLYFLVYLAYSAILNALDSVMLVEIWTAPLFGLGLSILYTISKQKETTYV